MKPRIGIILIFVILFIFTKNLNSFAGPINHKQTISFDDGAIIAGIKFNNDGTKLFTVYGNITSSINHVNEYSLSKPYDISTRSYSGDNERCVLTNNEASNSHTIYDLELSSDGRMLFVTSRNPGSDTAGADQVFRYDLSKPYDISTCSFHQKTTDLDQSSLTSGSNAGDFDHDNAQNRKHRLQGLEFSDDGRKLFLIFFDTNDSNVGSRLYEYTLSTPYDLSTLSLNKNAGIEFNNSTTNGVNNPASMRFSSNGRRIFLVSHDDVNASITQVSLIKPYDTSSFIIHGRQNIFTGLSDSSNKQPRGVAFSKSGLKLYIGNDNNMNSLDQIMEYDLACPFNIFEGNCPEINEDKDRLAMAEANIDLAKRTIDYSTKSVLNRLKWIKRNKDKQDLSNLNIDFHFLNPKFNTLSKAFGSTIKNTSLIKKNDFKEGNIFYWSEGSVALGKAGETNLSSSKDIKVQSLTYGADKYTKNNGIIGLALRWGVDKVDVGKGNSRIDSNSLNLTLYNTNNLKNNSRFADSILGIGLVESDIFSDFDSVTYVGENRLGKQIYSTFKVSEHFKKKNLTLIPSGQWDLGFTVFDDYYEKKDQTGNNGGIQVKKQNVKTGSLRAAIAAVQEINHEKYNGKKFGKIEYQSQIMHASNFKYRYTSDQSKFYLTRIDPDSEHHINGEVGFDINLDKYSYFMIYERNQALNYGYTDQIHFAFGYLPDNNTEFSITIDGIDTLANNLKYEKKFNNLNFSFNLKNDLLDPLQYQEANLNLKTKF